MRNKTILSTSIIIGLVLLLAAMFVVAAESPAGRVTYLVPKITCGACAQTIGTELKAHAGVTDVEVDVAQTLVKVSFDEKQTDAGEIALTLAKSGYPGRVVALNGQSAPAEIVAKKAGGCGGCCDKTTR